MITETAHAERCSVPPTHLAGKANGTKNAGRPITLGSETSGAEEPLAAHAGTYFIWPITGDQSQNGSVHVRVQRKYRQLDPLQIIEIPNDRQPVRSTRTFDRL